MDKYIIFAITFVFGILRFLTVTKEGYFLLKNPVDLILTDSFLYKFDKDVNKYVLIMFISMIFHTLRAIGDKLMYLFLIIQVYYWVEFGLKVLHK